MKQSIKGTKEWDKEFHPFLNLSVIVSSYEKISFGSTGKPSRASIPAAIVSRNPLIP